LAHNFFAQSTKLLINENWYDILTKKQEELVNIYKDFALLRVPRQQSDF